VLLNPARDEDAKRNEGIIVEKREHAVKESLNSVLIEAFVQTIEYDEEWTSFQPVN
jgi:hypothetical protein